MSDSLARIKQLYFGATKATIVATSTRHRSAQVDASEDERERATVYMQGLAEMRSQWAASSGRFRRPGKPANAQRARRR